MTERRNLTILSLERFSVLLDELVAAGYRLVGPTIRGDSIVLDEIQSVADLPTGWTAEQTPGSYRLMRRDDQALFGYSVGPKSWKRHFFIPHLRILSASLKGQGLEIHEP